MNKKILVVSDRHTTLKKWLKDNETENGKYIYVYSEHQLKNEKPNTKVYKLGQYWKLPFWPEIDRQVAINNLVLSDIKELIRK